jgi:hypothetical protein
MCSDRCIFTRNKFVSPDAGDSLIAERNRVTDRVSLVQSTVANVLHLMSCHRYDQRTRSLSSAWASLTAAIEAQDLHGFHLDCLLASLIPFEVALDVQLERAAQADTVELLDNG